LLVIALVATEGGGLPPDGLVELTVVTPDRATDDAIVAACRCATPHPTNSQARPGTAIAAQRAR
jgi:hypothetical protein